MVVHSRVVHSDECDGRWCGGGGGGGAGVCGFPEATENVDQSCSSLVQARDPVDLTACPYMTRGRSRELRSR